MAKLVSKTYGEALFELAEEGREDAFLTEIVALREVLKENPDFNKLMNHPKILKEEKLKVLDDVFEGRISKELSGFLHLVVSKDRYGEIDAILDYFIDEVKKLKGIGIAYVTTAIPLSLAKQKEIEEKLLIGGMVIRIGDRVVDSSIKTKLFEMRRTLLKTKIEQ